MLDNEYIFTEKVKENMTINECKDYCDSDPLCLSLMYGEKTNPKDWMIGTCYLKRFAPNSDLDPILIRGTEAKGFTVWTREQNSKDCGTEIKDDSEFTNSLPNDQKCNWIVYPNTDMRGNDVFAGKSFKDIETLPDCY